jgi:O-antigen/teichoic acid export membrane protein
MQTTGNTPGHETVSEEEAAAIRSLSSSRTVAKSAMWNLVGRAGPLLVAIFSTPILVRHLGPSRWGVFTIALSLVGIFSIFDLGIGRSLTRAISELIAENRRTEAASLARSGIAALTVLGTVGGLLMASLAHIWVTRGLHMPDSLHDEVLHALYVLCLSAPVVILSSALWGVIAAFQRFRSANLVNVPIMAMYYIGPIIVLYFYNSLVAVLAVLVACRVVMALCYWRICVHALPELKQARAEFAQLKPVLRMGGWMTASNLTWPILTYFDRFIIASVLSAAATGYYSTPFDLVQRFTILPVAIMNTAYPAMAASYRSDPDNTCALFRRSLVSVTGALFPACLLCVALSHWLLHLWLGAGFALHATVVLRWLGVGILLTSVDSVVAGLLDGIGKASVNAKFSFLEIAVYLPLLAFLVRKTGIEGAAVAWTLRCLVDLTVRLWVAQRLYAPVRPAALSTLPLLLGVTGTLFATALVEGTRWVPVTSGVGTLLVGILLWFAFTQGERARLISMAGRFIPALQRSSA